MLGIGIILDNLKTAEDGPNVLNLPGHAFVDALAKINITRNAALRGDFSDINSKVAISNSRDFPTVFFFECPNKDQGCEYKHHHKRIVEIQARVCNPIKKSAKSVRSFKCDRLDKDGNICSAAYASKKNLRMHISSFHNWMPIKYTIENCSEPTRIFQDSPKF